MLRVNIRSTEEILDSMITRFKLSSDGVVTRLGHTSVLRGILYAFASAAHFVQQVVVSKESKLYLSSCYGQDLDDYASKLYNMKRRGNSFSSCEVIAHGAGGTVFPLGQVFRTKSGIEYKSTKETSIPTETGYVRIPVTSSYAGSAYKVYRNQLIVCDNPPVGFTSCYNLVPAIGGYDAESDEDFRRRIQSVPSMFETETPAKMEAIVYAKCPDVARCSVITSSDGGMRVYVLPTSEGYVSTPSETVKTEIISEVRSAIASHCSLSVFPNITVLGYHTPGVELDLSVRVSSENTELIEREIQDALIAFFDPRFITKTEFTPEKLTASLLEIPEITDLVKLDFYDSLRSVKMTESSIPTLSKLTISMLTPDGTWKNGTFDKFGQTNPLHRVECATNSADVTNVIYEFL